MSFTVELNFIPDRKLTSDREACQLLVIFSIV